MRPQTNPYRAGAVCTRKCLCYFDHEQSPDGPFEQAAGRDRNVRITTVRPNPVRVGIERPLARYVRVDGGRPFGGHERWTR